MGRVWPLRRHTLALLAFIMTILGYYNILHRLEMQRDESGLRLQDVQQQHVVLEDEAEATADQHQTSDSAHNMACLRQGQGGTLVFLHMRKAAGSSLWKLLWSLVDEDGGDALRGGIVHRAEGRTFNRDYFDSSAVFLTALRDPISRILSSYHYEGRHFRYDYRMYFESKEKQAEAEARLRDRKLGASMDRVAKSLRQWVGDVQRDYQIQSMAFNKHSVWIDVENYYIKTLTNRHRANAGGPVTREDLELAKDILGRMDVMLITEWLKEADQVAYFNSVLGLQNVTFPEKHLSDKTQVRDEAEEEDEALMIEQLREMNQLDLELYEWAKSLVRSRIDAEVARNAQGGALSEKDERLQCIHMKISSRFDKKRNRTTRAINAAPPCFGPPFRLEGNEARYK